MEIFSAFILGGWLLGRKTTIIEIEQKKPAQNRFKVDPNQVQIPAPFPNKYY